MTTNLKTCHFQGFRPQYINKGGRPSGKPLKFDDDFDFEKANNQFEELINVFSKTKVSDDPKTDVQVFLFFCFFIWFWVVFL